MRSVILLFMSLFLTTFVGCQQEEPTIPSVPQTESRRLLLAKSNQPSQSLEGATYDSQGRLCSCSSSGMVDVSTTDEQGQQISVRDLMEVKWNLYYSPTISGSHANTDIMIQSETRLRDLKEQGKDTTFISLNSRGSAKEICSVTYTAPLWHISKPRYDAVGHLLYLNYAVWYPSANINLEEDLYQMKYDDEGDLISLSMVSDMSQNQYDYTCTYAYTSPSQPKPIKNLGSITLWRDLQLPIADKFLLEVLNVMGTATVHLPAAVQTVRADGRTTNTTFHWTLDDKGYPTDLRYHENDDTSSPEVHLFWEWE